MGYHICIYLLKEQEYVSLDIVIRKNIKYEKYEIDAGALRGCVIYKSENDPHEPEWLPLLKEINNANFFKGLINTSSKLVLAIRIESRVFCVVFGHGRFMIKEELIERNFGIKVVLNSVKADSIRAVDTKKIENKSTASRTQTSTLTHINNFTAKDFGNFLMGITGKSNFNELGITITGTDSFSFNYKYKITDLPVVLKFIYERYLSTDYLTDFEFFDRMHYVKDKLLIKKLNNKLVDRINKSQLNSIILAPPVILEWEKVAGFKYTSEGPINEELDIESYFNLVRVSDFETEKFKQRKILAVDSNGKELYKWSLYDCFVLETSYNKISYVLTSGLWFELDKDFVKKINDFIDNIPNATIKLPSCNKNYTEGQYNDKVGEKNNDILTMDSKLVRIDGKGIEVCDLLTKNKQFVHVKPWKSSSTLSHLFSQGVVSGASLMEEDNRKLIVDKIKSINADFKDLIEEKEFNSHDYEIVFAIIYEGTKNISKRLPFFSKLNMMINVRLLTSMNYKVSKHHIEKRSV